jgi:hypothetical protein
MHRRQLSRADHGRRAAAEDDPHRLIRLIDELRALDLERRRQPVASAAFRDLALRMEAKAREVFAEAADTRSARVEADEDPGARRTH